LAGSFADDPAKSRSSPIAPPALLGTALPMAVPNKLQWKIVSISAGALAAMMTRRVLTAAWKGVQDEPPPDSPANRGTPIRVALIWAIATGVGAGVMRLLAARGATRGWEAVKHEPPPV
jgi:hypothetical protein